MKKYKKSRGQTVIEYALIAAIVTVAITAMSTYVYRSVQSTQRTIQEGINN